MIPKIIWQTFKTNKLHKKSYEYVKTWKELNPDYEYRFFTDNDIIEFIKNEFPEYLNLYKKITIGAIKSDFWRLLVLYKYGGIYADIDSFCSKPLNTLIKEKDTYITCIHKNHKHCQHFCLIVEAKNDIIKLCLDQAIYNLENYNIKTIPILEYYGFKLTNKIEMLETKRKSNKTFSFLGPDMFQNIYENLYKNDKELFNSIRFCSNMNFDDTIYHEQPKDWGNFLYKQKTPHYALIK